MGPREFCGASLENLGASLENLGGLPSKNFGASLQEFWGLPPRILGPPSRILGPPPGCARARARSCSACPRFQNISIACARACARALRATASPTSSASLRTGEGLVSGGSHINAYCENGRQCCRNIGDVADQVRASVCCEMPARKPLAYTSTTGNVAVHSAANAREVWRARSRRPRARRARRGLRQCERRDSRSSRAPRCASRRSAAAPASRALRRRSR